MMTEIISKETKNYFDWRVNNAVSCSVTDNAIAVSVTETQLLRCARGACCMHGRPCGMEVRYFSRINNTAEKTKNTTTEVCARGLPHAWQALRHGGAAL
jgi:hypothetical protein